MRGFGRSLGAVIACTTLGLGACKPVRYMFGWRARLKPDTTERAGGQSLVGAGDIGFCGLIGDRATAILLDQIPGTVFTAGDNAYPDGTLDDFQKCYEPTWGRHKSRTRPSAGNHEYHDGRATGYFAYFGAAAGDSTKGYYSYELGAWHVVVLNSNIDVGDGSEQIQWLRTDLAAHPTQCTVAYWHHAYLSSSPDATPKMRPVWQVLYDAGVEVAVTGHHHAYERFAPVSGAGTLDRHRGVREFVVGTGGSLLDNFGHKARFSERRYNDNYGVLQLQLYPGHYAWQFVSVNGHIRDSGSDRCH
jgi:acid phosphatase type 7